jgi:hypothetical protein
LLQKIAFDDMKVDEEPNKEIHPKKQDSTSTFEPPA